MQKVSSISRSRQRSGAVKLTERIQAQEFCDTSDRTSSELVDERQGYRLNVSFGHDA